MLEGAIATGVIALANKNVFSIVCIGGGPGFELIACKLFFRRRLPNCRLSLTCLDFSKSWGRYVTALGWRFQQRDFHSRDLMAFLDSESGQIDYVILGNIVSSPTDQQIVDFVSNLLHESVRAVLVPAGVLAKGTCEIARKSGIKIVSLIDQAKGCNVNQLAFMVFSTVPLRGTRECLFPEDLVVNHN